MELSENGRQNILLALVILSLVCACSSFLLFVSAVNIKTTIDARISLLETYNSETIPGLFLFVGIINVVENVSTAFVCHKLMSTENRERLLKTSIPLLVGGIILCVLEVSSAIASFVHIGILDNEFGDGIQKAMAEYSASEGLKREIDYVQVTYECCGENSYTDWFTRSWIDPSYLVIAEAKKYLQDDGKYYSDDCPYSCCDRRSPRPCIHHHIHDNNLHYNYDYRLETTLHTNGCRKILMATYAAVLTNMGIISIVTTALKICNLLQFRLVHTSLLMAQEEGDWKATTTAYIYFLRRGTDEDDSKIDSETSKDDDLSDDSDDDNDTESSDDFDVKKRDKRIKDTDISNNSSPHDFRKASKSILSEKSNPLHQSNFLNSPQNDIMIVNKSKNRNAISDIEMGDGQHLLQKFGKTMHRQITERKNTNFVGRLKSVFFGDNKSQSVCRPRNIDCRQYKYSAIQNQMDTDSNETLGDYFEYSDDFDNVSQTEDYGQMSQNKSYHVLKRSYGQNQSAIRKIDSEIAEEVIANDNESTLKSCGRFSGENQRCEESVWQLLPGHETKPARNRKKNDTKQILSKEGTREDREAAKFHGNRDKRRDISGALNGQVPAMAINRSIVNNRETDKDFLRNRIADYYAHAPECLDKESARAQPSKFKTVISCSDYKSGFQMSDVETPTRLPPPVICENALYETPNKTITRPRPLLATVFPVGDKSDQTRRVTSSALFESKRGLASSIDSNYKKKAPLDPIGHLCKDFTSEYDLIPTNQRRGHDLKQVINGVNSDVSELAEEESPEVAWINSATKSNPYSLQLDSHIKCIRPQQSYAAPVSEIDSNKKMSTVYTPLPPKFNKTIFYPEKEYICEKQASGKPQRKLFSYTDFAEHITKKDSFTCDTTRERRNHVRSSHRGNIFMASPISSCSLDMSPAFEDNGLYPVTSTPMNSIGSQDVGCLPSYKMNSVEKDKTGLSNTPRISNDLQSGQNSTIKTKIDNMSAESPEKLINLSDTKPQDTFPAHRHDASEFGSLVLISPFN